MVIESERVDSAKEETPLTEAVHNLEKAEANLEQARVKEMVAEHEVVDAIERIEEELGRESKIKVNGRTRTVEGRKTPSVPCVVRSLTKLIRMRGENCVDASVSVISRIANTIDTTVIIEVAMLLRITCATPGSSCEGKRVLGIQALILGIASSSSDESTAPAAPGSWRWPTAE
jgi:hypothetical protein